MQPEIKNKEGNNMLRNVFIGIVHNVEALLSVLALSVHQDSNSHPQEIVIVELLKLLNGLKVSTALNILTFTKDRLLSVSEVKLDCTET